MLRPDLSGEALRAESTAMRFLLAVTILQQSLAPGTRPTHDRGPHVATLNHTSTKGIHP
jgi:hypothetical protein